MKKISDQQRRRVKALMPLVLLPFLALMYTAFSSARDSDEEDAPKNAFNVVLPGAQVDDSKPMDKMSLYEKAEEDSARHQMALRNDPFGMLTPQTEQPDTAITADAQGRVSTPFENALPGFAHPPMPATHPDRQVEALEKKLGTLQQLIEQSEPAAGAEMHLPSNRADTEAQRSLQAAETMMSSLQQQTTAGGDAELNQMDGMLEKLLDIKYPERVSERYRQQTIEKDGMVLPVLAKPDSRYQQYFGLMPVDDTTQPQSSGQSVFYGSQQRVSDTATENTGIAAVVHQSQEIVSGSTIKIRLDQPVYVKGRLIPKGSFLFGSCNLSGERLQVEISSIRFEHLLFPVKLVVYDFDGNSGIRIPGSISRDASKQSADQAIQAVTMTTLDPSLGAQAASAGIETAKSLLSKKVRLIRVTVKADYPVLLKSDQQ